MKTHTPKACLYDLDGVLVDSEFAQFMAWTRLLEELALPVDRSVLRSMMGNASPDILRAVLNRFRPGWSAASYDIVALTGKKDLYYQQVVPSHLHCYDGVREGLQLQHSHGVKIGAVSNATRSSLQLALKTTGILPYFDLVLSRDDFPELKPSPAGYLMALKEMKVSALESMAVEDSPPGAAGALLAGIPTVAVLTGFSRDVLETPVEGRKDLRPTHVVGSMRDFFELFATFLRS